MGYAEDLNTSGQTSEQPSAGPSVETLRTDSISESSGAHWFVEDLTIAADGVGGGERSATMMGESMEMLGATVEAGATDVMPESRA